MKLKGEYELVINVELPDGTYVAINKMVYFCLNENYEVIQRLIDYKDIEYFDDSVYGCLQTEKDIYWIRNYFINQGYVEKDWYKILNREKIIEELTLFRDWSEEYLNNSAKYDRDVKIDMLK